MPTPPKSTWYDDNQGTPPLPRVQWRAVLIYRKPRGAVRTMGRVTGASLTEFQVIGDESLGVKDAMSIMVELPITQIGETPDVLHIDVKILSCVLQVDRYQFIVKLTHFHANSLALLTQALANLESK